MNLTSKSVRTGEEPHIQYVVLIYMYLGQHMIFWYVSVISHITKSCLKRPLKIDKTKVLMENGSLMKVESIAKCSLGAFCIIFDLHEAIIGLENQFWHF